MAWLIATEKSWSGKLGAATKGRVPSKIFRTISPFPNNHENKSAPLLTCQSLSSRLVSTRVYVISPEKDGV